MAKKQKKEIHSICIHWTAGYNRPNNEDMQHYHIIVDDKGNYYKGIHSIESNIDCKDGEYAQHCALGNTGVIGIAVCGMAGFSTNSKVSKSNLTRLQMEALFKKCSDLCKEYEIEVSPSTVYTHMEYDHTHAKKGKIDIVYIPYLNLYGMEECGNYIREKILWYYKNTKGDK
jgi:hypothetical protein